MIDLYAYSISGLQTGAALCRQAVEAGMTLQELSTAIDSALPTVTSRADKQQDRCPACGRAALLPVLNHDGLMIVGCKSCRYSEVR